MKAIQYVRSLRFKITFGLLLSLLAALVATSFIGYLWFERLLMDGVERTATDAQEIVGTQLATYVRSRLFLSLGSIAATVLITELIVRSTVVRRLRQFLTVVKQVSLGNLDARAPATGDDEIAELARAFNHMAEELQRRDKALSTLSAIANTVSQSLDLEGALQSGLDGVLELMRLSAGWIALREYRDNEFHLAAACGLNLL